MQKLVLPTRYADVHISHQKFLDNLLHNNINTTKAIIAELLLNMFEYNPSVRTALQAQITPILRYYYTKNAADYSSEKIFVEP